MKKVKVKVKVVINALLSALLINTLLPALVEAKPENWSVTDSRCPKSSDPFEREAETIKGEGGIYFVCYWLNTETGEYKMSMRPTHIMGGFERSMDDNGQGRDYYINYYRNCAQQYVDHLGFCGVI